MNPKDLMMGPSALRIAEELCAGLELPAGARILDLGCGRGLSTLYLAERYPDATIVAADLWIDPTENLILFREEGVADRVIPLKAEATELPFAAEYFDAVVSIDCWQYFGADPEFLGTHIAPLLVSGGRLLVAVPGWKDGHDESVPEALAPWVKDEFNFRTASWWLKLWSACPDMKVTSFRDLDCNADAWADWLECDNEYARGDVPMIKADAGRWFAFPALEARKG